MPRPVEVRTWGPFPGFPSLEVMVSLEDGTTVIVIWDKEGRSHSKTMSADESLDLGRFLTSVSG